MTARIGIVGGSGLYDMPELAHREERVVATPFGDPSDAYVLGELSGVPVAFLARHGRGHRHSPTEVPYRANVWGFKVLGCDAIFSASAAGSLREELAPSHVCVPDQFIDRTRKRVDTFFRDGIVAHVSLADPVCPAGSQVLVDAARGAGAVVQAGGTYVCMEGPPFSTRAESNLYRSWGASVIGMTNLTEAKLAREAEICYATMALVTDYDCWREATEAVSVDTILAVLRGNAVMAQRALLTAVKRLDPDRRCACRDALRYAILTDPARIPAKVRADLAPILGKRLP
ncbi:MAG TPA: S-methyl-5'-thioadenosine phosphorylase [Thermoanaerobaculia bacterium]|nr:S-methyl-5'-thioadenosine phosphorylase [Thermoanaerobaculia bacterium]